MFCALLQSFFLSAKKISRLHSNFRNKYGVISGKWVHFSVFIYFIHESYVQEFIQDKPILLRNKICGNILSLLRFEWRSDFMNFFSVISHLSHCVSMFTSENFVISYWMIRLFEGQGMVVYESLNFPNYEMY